MKNKKLLLIILLALLLRSLWFNTLVERDEGTFAYVGQMWSQGHIPYGDVLDNKPPFTYLLNMYAYLFFGNNIGGIRLLNDLFFIISIIAFNKIMNSFKIREAWLATLAYALIMNLPVLEGPLALTESLSVPLLVISYFLFLKSDEHRPFSVLSGLIAGLALMINLKSGILYVLLLSYTAYRVRDGIRRRIRYFLLGYLFPPIAFFQYFLSHGIFLFQRYFNSIMSFYLVNNNVVPVRLMVFLVLECSLFVYLGILGFIAFTKQKAFREHKVFVITFILASVLVINVSPYFTHYYLLASPFIAFLCAKGVSQIRRSRFKRPLIALLLVAATMTAYFAFIQYPDYTIDKGPFYWRYSDFSSRAQQEQLASYIKDNTDPSSTFLYDGWEPYLAFRSEREMSTKFTQTYCLPVYNSTTEEYEVFYLENISKVEMIVYLPGYGPCHNDTMLFQDIINESTARSIGLSTVYDTDPVLVRELDEKIHLLKGQKSLASSGICETVTLVKPGIYGLLREFSLC